MDDLIVIILTLVIAVVGALGQIKKKKQAQAQPGQEKKPSFWDLLDGEIDTQPPLEEPELVEEKVVPQVEPVKTSTRLPEIQHRKKMVRKVELKKELTKQGAKQVLDENFSLRKAVIYSEILNRKYS